MDSHWQRRVYEVRKMRSARRGGLRQDLSIQIANSESFQDVLLFVHSTGGQVLFLLLLEETRGGWHVRATFFLLDMDSITLDNPCAFRNRSPVV